MAVTTQQLLDECNAALLRILSGRAAEFYEQNDRVRLLEIHRLQDLRKDLERQVSQETGRVFMPIVPVDV